MTVLFSAGVRESVGLYYPYKINGSNIVWSEVTPLVWAGKYSRSIFIHTLLLSSGFLLCDKNIKMYDIEIVVFSITCTQELEFFS